MVKTHGGETNFMDYQMIVKIFSPTLLLDKSKNLQISRGMNPDIESDLTY